MLNAEDCVEDSPLKYLKIIHEFVNMQQILTKPMTYSD